MSQDDTPGPVAASPIHPAVQQQLDALNKACKEQQKLTRRIRIDGEVAKHSSKVGSGFLTDIWAFYLVWLMFQAAKRNIRYHMEMLDRINDVKEVFSSFDIARANNVGVVNDALEKFADFLLNIEEETQHELDMQVWWFYPLFRFLQDLFSFVRLLF